MIPLHWMTVLFGGAAGLCFTLPREWWLPGLLGLAAIYLLVIVWGTCVQTSPLLGPCVTRGPARAEFALTFDDGPDPDSTAAVLDLLAERRATATFFCIGRHVEQHPDTVRRIHAEGHLLGNHSFSHSVALTYAGSSRLTADLRRCQNAIEATVGYRPRFFRPPFGLRNHSTHKAVTHNDMRCVGWNAGGLDTTRRSTETIVKRCTATLGPGTIILLHDHGPAPAQTLEVVRQVLDAAETLGLQPVRLDRLLEATDCSSAAE